MYTTLISHFFPPHTHQGQYKEVSLPDSLALFLSLPCPPAVSSGWGHRPWNSRRCPLPPGKCECLPTHSAGRQSTYPYAKIHRNIHVKNQVVDYLCVPRTCIISKVQPPNCSHHLVIVSCFILANDFQPIHDKYVGCMHCNYCVGFKMIRVRRLMYMYNALTPFTG